MNAEKINLLRIRISEMVEKHWNETGEYLFISARTFDGVGHKKGHHDIRVDADVIVFNPDDYIISHKLSIFDRLP